MIFNFMGIKVVFLLCVTAGHLICKRDDRWGNKMQIG